MGWNLFFLVVGCAKLSFLTQQEKQEERKKPQTVHVEESQWWVGWW
jgi:hypothetical protein